MLNLLLCEEYQWHLRNSTVSATRIKKGSKFLLLEKTDTAVCLRKMKCQDLVNTGLAVLKRGIIRFFFESGRASFDDAGDRRKSRYLSSPAVLRNSSSIICWCCCEENTKYYNVNISVIQLLHLIGPNESLHVSDVYRFPSRLQQNPKCLIRPVGICSAQCSSIQLSFKNTR
ncbi:LANO_0B00188g1_1 [Lachancea nothofagi CBS 11611]|uniref:LANO_0B00188g1_1 n=1 Tax=Lachancea nothofagi CBS 11611 TaxID=1266666 RepID=A0A1G4ITZ0_9SACH|nr:LANO_0B00188g1_1 [Lachancea nothofagi CBS 11611]